MMRDHEEFAVETDTAGEPPFSFWSETVRRVVVESTTRQSGVIRHKRRVFGVSTSRTCRGGTNVE
jgi:hypothetical protein